jgi:predicted NBD/HSP70 family sugar kinase
MKPAKPLALGIDIGGTNTKVGLVDGSGNILTRKYSARVKHGAVLFNR